MLRSGRRSKYYLDKYRFETRPDLLGPLGDAIAAAVREHEPDATRLAGPELGAVALAAAASLAGGLPFLIVRRRREGLRHRQPPRRRLRGGRAACASSRTSSPRAERRSRRSRRCARQACEVRNAVCVVDREEGGVDGSPAPAVRLEAALPGLRAALKAPKLPVSRAALPQMAQLSDIRPMALLACSPSLTPKSPT